MFTTAHRRTVVVAAIAWMFAAGCGASAPSPSSAAEPSSQVFSIDLVAATPNALPKCTSALAGTTVFVQSPVSLYSCQASA